MLAGIFRTNQNYILLVLLLIAPALWAPSIYFAVDQGATQAMPLFKILSDWVSDTSILPAIIGLALTLLIAVISNAVYNDLELFERRDHLSALLFVVLASVSNYSNSLNPALCALPFLVLVMNKIARLGESKRKLALLFNSGLLIGIASFFYLPALLFAIPSLVMLPLLGRSEWRELFALLFGSLFPFLFTVLLASAFGTEASFSSWQPALSAFSDHSILALASLFGIFAISMPAAISYYGRSIMRIKNYKAGIAGYMVLFAFIGVSEVFLERPCGFLFLAFPAAYYSSYLFRQTRSMIISETVFTLLLAIAFWMQWSFINP